MGRLWFGTMDNPERSIKKGSLYCLDQNLILHKVDTKYYIEIEIIVRFQLTRALYLKICIQL